jgi:hypothetical protein
MNFAERTFLTIPLTHVGLPDLRNLNWRNRDKYLLRGRVKAALASILRD